MTKTNTWDKIARKIVLAIINIQVTRSYFFDTMKSSEDRAIEFVVNKKLDLICTNAHVLSSASLSARATFFEWESFEPDAANVNLFIIYTDPVHDFAFARYNTKDLKIDDIKSVQLSFAQEVKVFQDICIMSNDAGQIINLLLDVISKINRNSSNLWNLFNDSSEYHHKFKNFMMIYSLMTHYFQESTNASEGNSKNPVINKKSDVVKMMSIEKHIKFVDYYLPVDKMRLCLKLLESWRSNTERNSSEHLARKDPCGM